jgi:Fic family protein
MIILEKFHSGTWRKSTGYQYFMPEKVNYAWQWSAVELNELLEKAAHRLGELNALSRFVPNIDLFIQMHVTREAVISSRIEGTQTNMEEALLPESEITPEKRNDWREVNNYIRAMNQAIAELPHLPLSGRLLRKTHQTLLQGVRGEHKLPGQYRSSQNWIGGASLADAVFIPPHHDFVGELMGDLENFIHNPNIHLPELIRVAVAHYQFETIHPFLDGNGRIGRLLITLHLIDKGLLNKPLLYLSAFFEKNKNLYYDNLTRVRTHNHMLQWVKYFLVGVEQAAGRSVHVLNRVLQLKTDTENLLHRHFGRRTLKGLTLLNHLLQHPIITIDTAAKHTGLSFKAAADLVATMAQHKLLKEITGHSRNRIFVFEPYLQAFEMENEK